MRIVALGLTTAALALSTGSATAATSCVDVTRYTAVCVAYTCQDHHCINRTVTSVYTTCDHPMPRRTCVTVVVPSGGRA